VNNGTTTSTIKWTPTASQAGSYVVTIGCYDSNNMQCTGQSSFSITVMRSFCGHSGTIMPLGCNPRYQNCSCSCASQGYDASQNCYQCFQDIMVVDVLGALFPVLTKVFAMMVSPTTVCADARPIGMKFIFFSLSFSPLFLRMIITYF